MRAATVGGGAILGYLALLHLVFLPLHEEGRAQGILGFVNGFGHLVEVPAHYFLGSSRRGTGSVLARALATTAFLSVLCFVVVGLRRRRPAQGPSLSRRSFLRSGAGLLAAGASAGVAYSLVIEPRRIEVSRRTLRVPGLPRTLDGLRIAQVTDVHLGPWLSLDFVKEAVRLTNRLDPDLILLTGDYVHRSASYIDPVVDALAGLRARIGIAGVLGNHDWWEGAMPMRQAFARAGIPMIDNSRIFVSPERKIATDAGEGLCIAGVGDLWEDEVRVEDALGGLPEEMPRILLSHNPDVAEDPRLGAPRHRVDLMLSGHTHGGQVWIPGLGTPVVPSSHGQKYAQGLVEGPACPVFICRGVGMTVLPVRLGVPPEIAVIELAA